MDWKQHFKGFARNCFSTLCGAVGRGGIVLFNKTEEIYFSVEFLRSGSISIVNLQNAMSPQLIWPQTACFSEISHQFSSVQLLSHVQLFASPWTVAHQACLSITNSWSLLKLVSIKSVMPSNHLILCHPLQSQHQGLFQWVSSSHQVAKVLELQLQHQSFQWRFSTDFL